MHETIKDILNNGHYSHIRLDGTLYKIVTRTPDSRGAVIIEEDGLYLTMRLADLEGATGERPYPAAPDELWFERTQHPWYFALESGIKVAGLRGGGPKPPRTVQEAECAVYVFDRFETVKPDPDLVAASDKLGKLAEEEGCQP